MTQALLKFSVTLLLFVGLSSCSKEEDSGPSLVGRWDIVKEQPVTYDLGGREYAYPVTAPTSEKYNVYSADGKFEIYENGNRTLTGSYTRKGKIVTITPADKNQFEAEITLITDTDLTMVQDARQLNNGIKAGVVYTTWFKKH